MGQEKSSDSNDNAISAIRVLFALIVCGLAVAYTVGVVAGSIPKDQQINAVHLGIIVLAAVARRKFKS